MTRYARSIRRSVKLGVFGLACLCPTPGPAAGSTALQAENAAMLREIEAVHGPDPAQMDALRGIISQGEFIGQGNPAIAEHPMTLEQCRAGLAAASVSYDNPEYVRICGGRYMAPLYDPSREGPDDAKSCIDQFEFPNIPCAYPVVWVRAREAAGICTAMGKRLCDAHEWEGACAGRLEPPDYRFDLSTGQTASSAVSRMGSAHNRARGASRRWAYGPAYEKGKCAAASRKSPGCDGGGWSRCGSNTYPAGAFPACRSKLDVFDQHGNAAEHMNLPLSPEQMASTGSRDLGHTEMKGSWFIFDRYYAHQDWCRWRAPYWHGGRVMDGHSHHNYHLGFRCCKTLAD